MVRENGSAGMGSYLVGRFLGLGTGRLGYELLEPGTGGIAERNQLERC